MPPGALLVAAGRGERLGRAGPKALVPVLGRPMLEWSLAALRAAGVEEVVVALPDGAPWRPPPGAQVVTGGAQRSHSVRNALAALDPAADPVLVHDAARPLVTAAIIEAVLAGLEGVDAATAAAPATDTTKEAGGDGIVRRTLDRSTLWAVQTPQGFHRAWLERALAQSDEVLSRATDDASLVEALGGRVRVVASPGPNPKVTTPLDLRLAELLLADADRPARPPAP